MANFTTLIFLWILIFPFPLHAHVKECREENRLGKDLRKEEGFRILNIKLKSEIFLLGLLNKKLGKKEDCCYIH